MSISDWLNQVRPRPPQPGLTARETAFLERWDLRELAAAALDVDWDQAGRLAFTRWRALNGRLTEFPAPPMS